MASRISLRLFFSLCYLALVFLAAGYLHYRLRSFEGVILIPKGKAEHVAVRPSAGGLGSLGVQRNLPAGVIAFDNPECIRYLGDTDLFDVTQLPFRLRLDEITLIEERAPREILDVMFPKNTVAYEARPGMRIDLGDGAEATIAAIRPWVGIIRSPHGQPMAVLSCRRPGGGWGDPAFLNTDAWLTPDPDTAIRLRWFNGEQAAHAHAAGPAPGIETARWGVEDGPAMHWLESFTPGSGAILSDETAVTLVQYEEKHAEPAGVHPAIEVQLERQGKGQRHWVLANRTTSGVPVHFEFPALSENVILVDAWRDGAAILAAYHQGSACGHELVEEGKTWRPAEAFPFELRLDQALAAALALPDTQGAIQEALLQTPTGELRLREGAAVQWEELRLRYRKEPVPPRVSYTLTAVPPEGKPRAFTLNPGQTRAYGAWRFRQDTEHADAARTALLIARRTVGSRNELLGALLFVVGATGLTVLRLRRPRRRSG